MGKHAKDYGLNPGNVQDREFMCNVIQGIWNNPDQIRYGSWRGAGERLPDGRRDCATVVLMIKDDDVVIVDLKGNFISIMKGGIHNERVKKAIVFRK